MKSNLLIVLFLVCMSCNFSKEQKISELKTDQNSKSYTISNDTLEVSIKSKGAELSSIKSDSMEYLWQGDSTYWKHQAPILFPIIGRLVDHEFIYQGKTYPMNFHGFAWKNNFRVIAKSSSSITFELTSSEKIKEIYPFDFILLVKYTLKDRALNVEYKVENPSKSNELYFSLGSHPAFNCPMEKNQNRSDYQLVFDVDAMPKSHDKESGLFIDQYTQYFKNPGILQLQDSTFNKGALVFNPNPFSKATLIHEPSQKEYFSLIFKNYPYLGIWSAKNEDNKIAPFVCIEPWYGLADKASHNKDYARKEGIMKLTPNEIFNCSITIEIL